MANVYYDELGKALVVVEHRFSLDQLKEWGRAGRGPQDLLKKICEEGHYNPSEQTLRKIFEALEMAGQIENLPFTRDTSAVPV